VKHTTDKVRERMDGKVATAPSVQQMARVNAVMDETVERIRTETGAQLVEVYIEVRYRSGVGQFRRFS
jgi:hypothetical protein